MDMEEIEIALEIGDEMMPDIEDLGL